MVFEVSFDLESLVILIITPAIMLFLLKTAWELGELARVLSRNKYVEKFIKENNKLWKENMRLQNELIDLKDKEGTWKE